MTYTVNEDKSSRYHRLGRRAGVLSGAASLALLAVLLATGASATLRDWCIAAVAGITERDTLRPNLVVGLYVLALAAMAEIVGVPFSFYRGFLVERRYGLSTENALHWLREHAKAVLIGLGFAEIAAALVYGALRRWPESWWIVSGLGYCFVTIWIVNLAPILLLPLFYRFKPLDKPSLRERLTALAQKAGTPVVGVYEWMLSDRTKKANAALAGLGHTRRILVSDTLLAEYSDEEIEVVLAHELAHHVHRDIWAGILYDTALTFAGFFGAHLALRAAVPLLGPQGPADPAGMPVLLIAAGTMGLVFKPLMNALSRAHERRADEFALQLTNNPSAFISAMRRIGQQNLAEDNPSRLVQAFFYTHPPIRERLRVAQERLATAR